MAEEDVVSLKIHNQSKATGCFLTVYYDTHVNINTLPHQFCFFGDEHFVKLLKQNL